MEINDLNDTEPSSKAKKMKDTKSDSSPKDVPNGDTINKPGDSPVNRDDSNTEMDTVANNKGNNNKPEDKFNPSLKVVEKDVNMTAPELGPGSSDFKSNVIVSNDEDGKNNVVASNDDQISGVGTGIVTGKL